MNNPPNLLTRGQLAKRSGIHAETIRYYEKIGLIPSPQRSPGGHRIYEEKHARRAKFIRGARDLGFSIREIKTLLVAMDEDQLTCAAVRAQTATHLDDIKEKITALIAMEQQLERLMAHCKGENRPECPIIEALLRS